jgi:hypothetical protein
VSLAAASAPRRYGCRGCGAGLACSASSSTLHRESVLAKGCTDLSTYPSASVSSKGGGTASFV